MQKALLVLAYRLERCNISCSAVMDFTVSWPTETILIIGSNLKRVTSNEWLCSLLHVLFVTQHTLIIEVYVISKGKITGLISLFRIAQQYSVSEADQWEERKSRDSLAPLLEVHKMTPIIYIDLHSDYLYRSYCCSSRPRKFNLVKYKFIRTRVPPKLSHCGYLVFSIKYMIKMQLDIWNA